MASKMLQATNSEAVSQPKARSAARFTFQAMRDMHGITHKKPMLHELHTRAHPPIPVPKPPCASAGVGAAVASCASSPAWRCAGRLRPLLLPRAAGALPPPRPPLTAAIHLFPCCPQERRHRCRRRRLPPGRKREALAAAAVTTSGDAGVLATAGRLATLGCAAAAADGDYGGLQDTGGCRRRSS